MRSRSVSLWTLGALLTALSTHAAPPFLKGPRDHSQCCGLGGAPLMVDGVVLHEPPLASADDLPRQPFRSRVGEPLAVAATNPPVASPAATTTPPAAPAAPTRPLLRIPGPPLSALDGPPVLRSGYREIGFSQLAGFPFVAPTEPLPAGTPPPDLLAQVPAAIRRLDGQKVVLTGFMLPTKLENGFATEFFFLSSSQLCCFGVTPAVTEWIMVKMNKEGLPAVQDVPLTLAGRLRVQPRWTDGFLTSLYTLEGDGLLKTKK